jgi:hypothetical protein
MAKTQATEEKAPTREEMIKWYTEQLEVVKLRAELSGLNRDIAVADAERYGALAALAQMQYQGDPQSQTEEEEDPASKETQATRTLKKD